jgi:hypothetical protein
LPRHDFRPITFAASVLRFVPAGGKPSFDVSLTALAQEPIARIDQLSDCHDRMPLSSDAEPSETVSFWQSDPPVLTVCRLFVVSSLSCSTCVHLARSDIDPDLVASRSLGDMGGTVRVVQLGASSSSEAHLAGAQGGSPGHRVERCGRPEG